MSVMETCLGKASLIEEVKKKLGLVIRDGAVTTNKIRDKAVTSDKIADNAITDNKMADGAVTERSIKDGIIEKRHLSKQCIAELQNASFTDEAIKSLIQEEVSKVQGNLTYEYVE